MWIKCTACGSAYPDDGLPYRCEKCHGIFEIDEAFSFEPKMVEKDLPGIWRYRHTFGLHPDAHISYLGEGDTPLIRTKINEVSVDFKLEYLNPTGSFKDRGTAVLTSWLRSHGVKSVIEDSSGNAGASLAAYVAHAGMRARIFVPDAASGPKKEQIRRFGAEIVGVSGPRSNCAMAVQREADKGHVYASHVFLPHGFSGFATIAYEVMDQLNQVPGTVVLPIGHGSLLLGVHQGFDILRKIGVIQEMPAFIGVQAHACAPIWKMFNTGLRNLNDTNEGKTLAEGVRIINPVRGESVIKKIKDTNGWIETVKDDDILYGRDQLAELGFYVEPTSAIVWPVLRRLLDKIAEPIVVILTGSGYKHGYRIGGVR